MIKEEQLRICCSEEFIPSWPIGNLKVIIVKKSNLHNQYSYIEKQ